MLILFIFILFILNVRVIYIFYGIKILFEDIDDNFHSLFDCLLGRRYGEGLFGCCKGLFGIRVNMGIRVILVIRSIIG